MRQHNYFYMALGVVLSFIFSLWQVVYAAPDIVAQNYAAANSPGINSCTEGYDLMSGDVAYSKPQIIGKLPFTLNYRAPLRQNLSAAQVFSQPEQTSMGWTHNYQSYVMVQAINSNTVEYPQYTLQQLSAPYSGKYYLTTYGASTISTFSAKVIIVRLPGESSDTVFKEENGVFSRLYSADAVGILNQYSVQQINWGASLGEYSLSRSGSVLTITKYGVSYTVSSNVYTMAPTHTETDRVNVYVDSARYFQSTRDSWSYANTPTGAISNTSTYLETTTTADLTLQRITKIQSQGQATNLQYDANLNLTQVTDNFNNKLVFEHNYDDSKVGSGQTIDESRLITKATYTSGSQGKTQVAEFNYKSYATKIPSTGANTTVFALNSSSSTIGSAYTYTNEMTELGAMKAYVASKGRTADLSYYYPVLKKVINAKSEIERQWDITQNYVLNSSSYSTAKTTLRVYTPSGVVNGPDNTSTYDDIAQTITTSFTLDTGRTVTSTLQTTPDGSGITITTSGYPCLTSSGRPIASAYVETDVGRVLGVTDRNNNDTLYNYDWARRLQIQTEAYEDAALKRETIYLYGPIDDRTYPYLTPTDVKAPNLTITNVVNTRGQITSQTQTSTQAGSTAKTTAYTYYEDSTKPTFGLLNTVDGPRSGSADKITYTYDAYGNLASSAQTVNSVNRKTQYVGYNSFGNPERIVNPNGMVTQFVYNADGTLKTKTIGAGSTTGTITGQTTSYTYDALKRLSTETNPDGETTSYGYDVIGRLIKTVQPDGGVINKTYYANNTVNTEQLTDSMGSIYNSSTQWLDDNGRVSKTRAGVSSDWYWKTYSYDNNGNLTTVVTRLGISDSWTYDALNRVKTHTDGNGHTDTKNYDVNDNTILAQDALGAGTNPYSYRNGNILTQEVNSDYGTKSYGYNEADQITSSLYGSRQCLYPSVDETGRNRSIICQKSSGSTFDTLIYNNSYIYDQSRYGRLDSVVSASNYGVDTSYGYDNYDWVTQKTQTNKALATWGVPQTSLTVKYSYSPAGKLTQITMPSGRNIKYKYNSAGQLIGIDKNSTYMLSNITYNAAGQMTGWTWFNNSGTYTMAYNTSKSNLITEITNKDTAGNINYRLVYDFDHDGRIIKMTRNNGLVDSFAYDNNNQILTESRKNGSSSVYNITYTYDANGNRKSLTSTGTVPGGISSASYNYSGNTLSGYSKNGSTQSTGYTGNAELVLSEHTPQYDYAGRRNRETPADSSKERYMAYNDKNERTLKSHESGGWGNTAIQYVYDEDSHLLGEYDKDGNTLVEYIWLGDKPVVVLFGNGTDISRFDYIVTDAQNTPHRLVYRGTASTLDWSWDSTAFGEGNPTGSITFNLRFPGQYYDVDSGQFYNHNRYYNPELGRYMEPDPIGLEGGLNPYSYCYNNPIMYVDPSGAIPLPIITGAIGGVVGGGASIGVQLWKNRGYNAKFSWADVGVAVGVGAVAGAVAPWTAGSAIGAVVTGSTANVAQYSIGQTVKGESITASGIAFNAATGAVGGAIGGSVSRNAGLQISTTSNFIPKTFAQSVNNNGAVLANVGNATLARGVAGGIAGVDPFGLDSQMNRFNIQSSQQLLNQSNYGQFQNQPIFIGTMPTISITAGSQIPINFDLSQARL